MQREEQIRVTKGLMAHLDNDTNVDAGGPMHNPVSSYTCPEAGSFFTRVDLGMPPLALE